MRKKLLLLGMALVALVSLQACGDDDDDEDYPIKPAQVEQKFIDAFRQKLSLIHI